MMQRVKKMPSGTYWLGDPQFCFTMGRWRELMDQMAQGRMPDLILKAQRLAVFEVERCGEFEDDEGNSYLVTSGFIGAIPESLVEEDPSGTNNRVVFPKEFDAGFFMPSVTFGKRTINIG